MCIPMYLFKIKCTGNTLGYNKLSHVQISLPTGSKMKGVLTVIKILIHCLSSLGLYSCMLTIMQVGNTTLQYNILCLFNLLTEYIKNCQWSNNELGVVPSYTCSMEKLFGYCTSQGIC